MRKRQASLLIELIVVVAIIALLAGAYLGLSKRGGKGEKSTPKAAMDKARSVECAANLLQLRALMETKVADDGRYPAALDPGNSMAQCPLTQKPYSYDPQAGRVWCTTPGHETL